MGFSLSLVLVWGHIESNENEIFSYINWGIINHWDTTKVDNHLNSKWTINIEFPISEEVSIGKMQKILNPKIDRDHVNDTKHICMAANWNRVNHCLPKLGERKVNIESFGQVLFPRAVTNIQEKT